MSQELFFFPGILFEFLIMAGNNLALRIKNQRPRTRCALIKGEDAFGFHQGNPSRWRLACQACSPKIFLAS